MKMPDQSLGAEWAVLELMSMGLHHEEMRGEFVRLVESGDLDWGKLLMQSLSHKLIAMLAYSVASLDIAERIPRYVRELLQRELAFNKHKNESLRREAVRITRAFTDRDIPFAATKGITFESTLYEGSGSRMLRDLDFMVETKNRDRVIETMLEMGYQTGMWQWEKGCIRPFSRRELLGYDLNKCHLPEFTRVSEVSVVEYIAVDFATSLTWMRSPYDVPLDIVFAENTTQPLDGFEDVRLPCLSPRFQFIFTILHLFREAWIERWLKTENDVNLIKFIDVMRLWEAMRGDLDIEEFVNCIKGFEIVDPILWVLEHLDRTFHTDIVKTLGMTGLVSEEWLSSGLSPGNKKRRWRGTMRERLHSSNRAALFEDVT